MRDKVYNNMWHSVHLEHDQHSDWLITNTKGDLVAETDDQETADHITKLHNDDLTKRRGY